MKYYIGFIGPGRLLAQTIRKLSDVAGLNIPGTVAGVLVTNGEKPELGLPEYSHWREMVLDCNLDFLVVLSDDPELKQDIRRNLSPDVDLVESVPAMIGISDLIACSIFKKKLNKKNKFLDSFIESIPFPVLAFNHHGFVTHWNSNCEKFTKVMAENVLGKRNVGYAFFQEERPLVGQMLINDYSLSKYRQFFPDPDLEIALTKDSVMIKGFMIFKGTIQGYYQLTSQKIFLDNKVIGAIELIQDLNALTFLQEEATKKQAALHSIVNHLPFPMIQSSLNGDIIFSNKAGAELLEQMTEQAQDTSSNLFSVCPEIKGEFADYIRSLSFEEEERYNKENQLNKTVYQNGAHWDVTCLIPPGQSTELIWIVRNVSLKEKESQLSTALAMVGTICHELSQPLTAIINSSQLLARTKPEDADRAQRHQKIINEQGERLFGIYKKLQNITQVRLQRYLDTQILDLDESADEINFQKNDTDLKD